VHAEPEGFAQFVEMRDAGPSKASINGWIDNGRLIRLKPAGDNVSWEVW
jgi:hypothetical protein